MLLIVFLFFFKGVVGVMGSGFIVLVVMFFVVGYLLVVGLVLIFGIDCFMLEVCVLINLVGNGVVIIVVVKWVKELDYKKLDDVLNNCVLDGKMYELFF